MTRISSVHHLETPSRLSQEFPMSPATQVTVLRARKAITRILNGTDHRRLLITGPCSVHDREAALAYAAQLAELAREVSDSLLIVMRVYVEKPRTRLGWKGLISDPHLDGSYDINAGLRLARGLMVEITAMGLPVACEFLDPAIARYFTDVVAWASIGARTVQSQVHRQFISGVGMPVGIKNATSGRVEDAVDAIVAAGKGHVFPNGTDNGKVAIVSTTGNPDCHVVLRGGTTGPNYDSVFVAHAVDLLRAAGLPESLVIDASHGNSGKDHERQLFVVADLARRIATGESAIAGVMLESFLAAGRQELELGRADRLAFGQSVTDACIDWTQTVAAVRELAAAVDAGRPSLTPVFAAAA